MGAKSVLFEARMRRRLFSVLCLIALVAAVNIVLLELKAHHDSQPRFRTYTEFNITATTAIKSEKVEIGSKKAVYATKSASPGPHTTQNGSVTVRIANESLRLTTVMPRNNNTLIKKSSLKVNNTVVKIEMSGTTTSSLKLNNSSVKSIGEEMRDLLSPNCSDSLSSKWRHSESNRLKTLMSETNLLKRLENCSNYFQYVPVAALNDSNEASRLRMAFSHQVHKEIVLLEILLAVMFRPWNVHCIHVDRKAKPLIHQSVFALAKCYNAKFGNVANPRPIHILPRPIPVYWGHISVLDADLMCLDHLLYAHKEWSHFANLAGTELPTRNYQHFEKVVANAPANENMMDSYKLPRFFNSRIDYYHEMQRFGSRMYDLRGQKTRFKKPPAPFGLQIYKGMKNVIITRNFSYFVLEHNIAKELYYWLQDTQIPDEFFFQTLARLSEFNETHAKQDAGKSTSKYVMPRFTVWGSSARRVCHGRWIRLVCNFATADLPQVQSSRALVANKFNLDVDARAPLCHWANLRTDNKEEKEENEEEKEKEKRETEEEDDIISKYVEDKSMERMRQKVVALDELAEGLKRTGNKKKKGKESKKKKIAKMSDKKTKKNKENVGTYGIDRNAEETDVERSAKENGDAKKDKNAKSARNDYGNNKEDTHDENEDNEIKNKDKNGTKKKEDHSNKKDHAGKKKDDENIKEDNKQKDNASNNKGGENKKKYNESNKKDDENKRKDIGSEKEENESNKNDNNDTNKKEKDTGKKGNGTNKNAKKEDNEVKNIESVDENEELREIGLVKYNEDRDEKRMSMEKDLDDLEGGYVEDRDTDTQENNEDKLTIINALN